MMPAAGLLYSYQPVARMKIRDNENRRAATRLQVHS
jgi:hypothetical protein